MRKLFLLSALTFLPALSGCFPLAATGAAATAYVAADRRTAGTVIDDETIELKASNRISEKLGNQVHVDVTSYNHVVLLTGEAPTEALKAEAEKIARGLPNVRNVVNEIQIAGPSSLASRSNDALITSKVKARFIDANKFSPNYVKVVTENGVVYLLGLVTHKEAEDAVQIARTTGGVRKVVKVFEYID